MRLDEYECTYIYVDVLHARAKTVRVVRDVDSWFQSLVVEVSGNRLGTVHPHLHRFRGLDLLREYIDQWAECVAVVLSTFVPPQAVGPKCHEDPSSMVKLMLAVTM